MGRILRGCDVSGRGASEGNVRLWGMDEALMGFALDLVWMMGALSRITAGRGCCFLLLLLLSFFLSPTNFL